jgi:hypothetical protein
MAEHDYIADSAYDPHPLSMQHGGPALPTVTPPLGMPCGLPPRGSAAVITNITSFRS